MTYALIRHGQTDWNRDDRMQGSSDIPLNDLGRDQAREAAGVLIAQQAEVLGGRTWDVIVSSPLSRARETAEIIAELLGIELGPAYPEFAERDYGPHEGDNATDCIRRYPDRDYPDSEPLEHVVQRGRAGLELVARDFPDANVVIVCHGTIIRYTLASLVGHAVDGIRNGTISTVQREPDGSWDVLTVNGIPLTEASTEAGATLNA